LNFYSLNAQSFLNISSNDSHSRNILRSTKRLLGSRPLLRSWTRY